MLETVEHGKEGAIFAVMLRESTGKLWECEA